MPFAPVRAADGRESVGEGRARQRLQAPEDRNLTLAAVALGCGFADYPGFSRAFRARFGLSPRDVRER